MQLVIGLLSPLVQLNQQITELYRVLFARILKCSLRVLMPVFVGNRWPAKFSQKADANMVSAVIQPADCRANASRIILVLDKELSSEVDESVASHWSVNE